MLTFNALYIKIKLYLKYNFIEIYLKVEVKFYTLLLLLILEFLIVKWISK
jgi:hypothetical protein